MGFYPVRQPTANGPKLRDTLEAAKGLLHDVLVKIELEPLAHGHGLGAEQTGETVPLLSFLQHLAQQSTPGIEEALQSRLDRLLLPRGHSVKMVWRA